VVVTDMFMPDCFFRDPFSPWLPNFIDPTEQLASVNRGRYEPLVHLVSHPIGHWHRSDVRSLTHEIDNCPVLLALLKMIQSQSYGLVPS
jgi:hypothetical protein